MLDTAQHAGGGLDAAIILVAYAVIIGAGLLLAYTVVYVLIALLARIV